MIDPALFRDHPDAVREALRNRGVDLTIELDALGACESERRQLLPRLEGLKREQNAAADEVGRAKREGRDTASIQDANRQRSQTIKQLDAELQALEAQRNTLLLNVPNVPHASVPVGRSASDNVEVRRYGVPRELGFAPRLSIKRTIHAGSFAVRSFHLYFCVYKDT